MLSARADGAPDMQSGTLLLTCPVKCAECSARKCADRGYTYLSMQTVERSSRSLTIALLR